jgi:hypothetical protein
VRYPEAGGVLEASRLYGQDWWLLDVQAHTARAPPARSRPGPGSSKGGDGQLLAIRIPHSA